MSLDRTVGLIELPEPTTHRMELVAAPREEKGGPPGAPISSWIELSDPQYITLSKTPASDDEELAQFLAVNDGRYRYDYVRLGCTFCPQKGERFDKAWLTVTLKPEGGQPSEVPISWSIFPLDDHDTIEKTVGAKIGASGKILNAETSASSKVARKLYNLRGYREGNPNPYWEMYGSVSNTLDGVLRFHMVVRSAVLSSTLGEIRLEAVISNRSFFVFREKRVFDQSPCSVFCLPPS
jgi:hypothetical protein